MKIVHNYGMTDNKFFDRIRESGGWPENTDAKYIAFFHAVKDKDRICEYFKTNIRTGWWTAIASRDDYNNYIAKWYRQNLRNQRMNGRICQD